MRPTADIPPGIAEIRAARGGFTIDFTQPLDHKGADNHKHYSIISYRRIPTPAYGGTDVDEKAGHVKKVKVSDDATRVTLKLDAMRAGHVYELRVEEIAPEGEIVPGRGVLHLTAGAVTSATKPYRQKHRSSS